MFSLLLGGHKRLPSPYTAFSGGKLMPGPEDNVDKDIAKRWKKPGDEKYTDYPALVKGIKPNFIRPDGLSQEHISAWERSDYMIVSASFLRCRQISLSWNVKRHVIANKRFNGFDPEVDKSVMPRTFTGGINIGF